MCTMNNTSTGSTASSVQVNKLLLPRPCPPHRRISMVREDEISSSVATATSSSSASCSDESVSSSVLSYTDCIEEEEHDVLRLDQEPKNSSRGGEMFSSSSPSSVLPQPRRMIFARYWKGNNNTALSSTFPIASHAVASSSVGAVSTFHPAGLIREPRSPLLEHYASSSSSSSSTPSSSPSAKINTTYGVDDDDELKPRRRSIFTPQAQSLQLPSRESSLESIDSFHKLFTSSKSKASHRHMTVLSSSTLDSVEPLSLSRRSRSNSCPEKNLTSCLKRRNGSSYSYVRDELEHDEGIVHQPRHLSSSSLSVTFDSHIEVVAFEHETASSLEVDQLLLIAQRALLRVALKPHPPSTPLR
ncbi:hypothetical protein FRACYDRAFT_270691 [Fragilariopsis cylindrus CCMP1102]|uniref:Uncharacterized protein n=1 Tax=Fragilariopsis cylindrus CCMP1102 TaxID=635003 RepID=A0A1E7F129_9STRA|nr:hypothetical protein FRACYDRAFT_270691 [Fragilariopsis cylindrus CCMP1102]|eukprot:OEU11900.1 hypothetical protein FRACYDRAFT_270691 [Fragilariopsis cylindrus CCMP1102]